MRFSFLRRNHERKRHQIGDVPSLRVANESDEHFDSKESSKCDQISSQFICKFDGGYEVTSPAVSPDVDSVNPTKVVIQNRTPRMNSVSDIRAQPRFVHELDDIPSPPRVTRKRIENRMEQLAELDRYIFSSWQLSDTSTESEGGVDAHSVSFSQSESSSSKRVKDLANGNVMIKVMSLDSQSNAMSTIAEIFPDPPSATFRSHNKKYPSGKPSCDLSATTVSSTSIYGNSSSDDDDGDDDNDYFSFSGYRNGQDGGISFNSGCIQPCGMVASDSLYLLEEIILAAITPGKREKTAN